MYNGLFVDNPMTVATAIGTFTMCAADASEVSLFCEAPTYTLPYFRGSRIEMILADFRLQPTEDWRLAFLELNGLGASMKRRSLGAKICREIESAFREQVTAIPERRAMLEERIAASCIEDTLWNLGRAEWDVQLWTQRLGHFEDAVARSREAVAHAEADAARVRSDLAALCEASPGAAGAYLAQERDPEMRLLMIRHV